MAIRSSGSVRGVGLPGGGSGLGRRAFRFRRGAGISGGAERVVAVAERVADGRGGAAQRVGRVAHTVGKAVERLNGEGVGCEGVGGRGNVRFGRRRGMDVEFGERLFGG